MNILFLSYRKHYYEHKTWGNKFIDNLAKDIKIAYPSSKGYSVRNLKYMAKFAAEYDAICADGTLILPHGTRRRESLQK